MQNEFHVSLIQVSCLLVLQPLSSRNAHFLEDVRTRLDEVSDIKCIISVVVQCNACMANEKENRQCL